MRSYPNIALSVFFYALIYPFTGNAVSLAAVGFGVYLAITLLPFKTLMPAHWCLPKSRPGYLPSRKKSFPLRSFQSRPHSQVLAPSRDGSDMIKPFAYVPIYSLPLLVISMPVWKVAGRLYVAAE